MRATADRRRTPDACAPWSSRVVRRALRRRDARVALATPRAGELGFIEICRMEFRCAHDAVRSLALVDLREARATVKRTPKEAPVCTCQGVQLVDHGAST